MVKSNVIIIRTNHDTPTHYLFEACRAIITLAESSFSVMAVDGKDVSSENVKKRLMKMKPVFVFFNGHGSRTEFYDNNREPFIGMDDTHIFKNTIVFARACDCLAELGKKSVENGCTSFIGYNRPFWIVRDNSMVSRASKDKTAQTIIECSNIVAVQLLHGRAVEDAVNRSHEFAAKNIVDLIYSKEPLMSAALPALVMNDRALSFEGDAAATL